MLRQMLNELNESRPPKERALTELHSAGIEGALARELSNGATKVARRGREALRAWLSGRIKERLVVTPSMLTDSTPRVIACVGPTGVGKTTTLAKLAARARLDHGRSVGVISLDTFRVGAVEQWQRYATLMGIPFQIASDRTSFQRAMADMPTDLVLVDTAGRSVHGTAWPLSGCLREINDRKVNVMLVLPAWLRANDVTRVLEDVRRPAAHRHRRDEARRDLPGRRNPTCGATEPAALRLSVQRTARTRRHLGRFCRRCARRSVSE